MFSHEEHSDAGISSLHTVISRSGATWGSTSVNRQRKISATSPTTLRVYFYIPAEIATAAPRNDGLDRLFHPSIYIGKMDGWKKNEPTPPQPKRVSAGLPRRVLDVSMREFSSLFAGYKNVPHVVVGCIYAERSGSVGVIISVLSSVMGALMVETPQSVPTAPSMQRHTMRVVLVI